MGNPAWTKGVSGNPAGRAPGFRTPQQKLLKRMVDEGGEILDAVLANAKAGDPASAALILNLIIPTLRAQSQTVQFELDTSLPLSDQLAQVAVAVAAGLVAPDIGHQISAILSNLATVRSSENLEERILILEARAVNR